MPKFHYTNFPETSPRQKSATCFRLVSGKFATSPRQVRVVEFATNTTNGLLAVRGGHRPITMDFCVTSSEQIVQTVLWATHIITHALLVGVTSNDLKRPVKWVRSLKKWVTWPWPHFLKDKFIFLWLVLATIHLLTNFEMSSLKYVHWTTFGGRTHEIPDRQTWTKPRADREYHKNPHISRPKAVPVRRL